MPLRRDPPPRRRALAKQIGGIDPHAFEQWRARQAYSVHAADRHREKRAKRLATLTDEAPGIRAATVAYSTHDDGSRRLIGLRHEFTRLATPRSPRGRSNDEEERVLTRAQQLALDVATRPPATRLVHRKSRALPFYLTALYIAHLESSPGLKFSNEHGLSARLPGTRQHSWVTLSAIGNTLTPRTRRTRAARAIEQLANAGLVGLRSGNAKYEKLAVLSDSGSQENYTLPGASDPSIDIPADLFRRGWHLALKPTELAMLLALFTHSAITHVPSGSHGVALPESLRDTRYGISGEVYESVHELAEFGLLQIIDPMPNRRRGKFNPKTLSGQSAEEEGLAPTPYRFVIIPDGLTREATDVITNCLDSSPLPPRITA